VLIPADYPLVSKRQRGHPLPEHVDVAILGGSAVACALAADLAARGVTVALLATSDFGSDDPIGLPLFAGARGLGGGFDLVQAAARRAQLADASTHWRDLVEPVRVMAPIADRRIAGARLRLGLAIGEALRPWNGIARHQRLRPRHVHGVAPFLAGGRVAAITVPDARFRAPYRAAVERALEAERAGAYISNDVSIVALEAVDGAIAGVRVRRRGRARTMRASRVVVAGGEAGARVLALAGAEPAVPPAPGLVFGAFELTGALPRDAAVDRVGGSPFFAVPAHQVLVAGPVEDTDDGPVAMASALVERLAGLVPGLGIREEQLRYVYRAAGPAKAGVREQPRLRGLFTIEGSPGDVPSLTTRLLAGVPLERPMVRTTIPTPQDAPDQAHLGRLTRSRLRQYRAGLGAMLEGDASIICPHSGAIAAEVAHVALHERPRSLADILLRRTGIAWAACRATCCDARAAAIAGEALGWSPEETERQFHDARTEIDATLLIPERAPASEALPAA